MESGRLDEDDNIQPGRFEPLGALHSDEIQDISHRVTGLCVAY